MKEQRVLADDEPINWVMRIASHNAYNNSADNYQIPNQTFSITDQLNGGARVIMLDIHGDPGNPVGLLLDGELRLSHAGADCVGCNPLDRPIVYAIKEIARWVSRHPDDIVIIEIEDYDISGANGRDLTGPLEKYLGSWIFRESEKPSGRWPTRREMLDRGRRVIVLSQSYHEHDSLFNGGWGGPYKFSLSGAKANNFDTDACTRFQTFNEDGSFNTQRFSEVWEDRSFIGSLEPAGVICGTGSAICETPPIVDAALDSLLSFLGINLRGDPLCCNDASQTTTMRELVECNTAIIGLDRFLDVDPMTEPLRLRETIWSWQFHYDAPNGHAAKLADGSDRWTSGPPSEVHPFACAKFRENDPNQWEDPAGAEWRITQTQGTWDEGFLACIFEFGAEGFTFSVPVTGYQQSRLVAERNAQLISDDVWLAYRDTTGKGDWRRDDGYDPDIWTSHRVVREGDWVEFRPKPSKLANCAFPREFLWDFGEGDIINNGTDPNIYYYYADERPLLDSVDFPVTVTEHYPGGECSDRTLDVFLFVFNDEPDVSLSRQDELFLSIGNDPTAYLEGTTFDKSVVDAQAVAIRWSPQTAPAFLTPSMSVNAPQSFDPNAAIPGTSGDFSAAHTFGPADCGAFQIAVTAADVDGGKTGTELSVELQDVTPEIAFPPSLYVLFEQDPQLESGLMSIDLGQPQILSDTICYPIQFKNDAPQDGFPKGLTIVTWTAQISDDGSDCADEDAFCETLAFASQTVYVSECLVPGDANLDCMVNRCDLIAINDRIGKSADGPFDPADVNRDGSITLDDVRFIENNGLCDEADCGSCGCNRWVQTGQSPEPLFDAAMTHDVHRGETVLFGGYISDGVTTLERNDTWLLDANGWTRASNLGATQIDARSNHAMSYDLARGVTITATGGPTINSGDNTWEWNGSSWTLRSDASVDVQPSSRSGAAMAYDQNLRQTVLFGGGNDQTQASETWIWNGARWVQRFPPVSPPPRRDHAMAFDSRLQTTILFGGSFSTQDLGDTWSWDGNNWTLLSAVGPSPRANMAMAYDADRETVILHGGSPRFSNNDPASSETWAWDGESWSLITGDGPMAPFGHTMAYDASRNQIVLFVPANVSIAGGPSLDVGQTWVLDGDTWVQIANTPPFARGETAMVYDSESRQSVIFAGNVSHPSFDPPDSDTWVYSDGMWIPILTTVAPGERYRHAMAYDAASQQIVLFGGADCCSTFSDTWVWDASTQVWSEVVGLSDIPDARSRHAMAYDSKRQVVVMVGGEDDGLGPCCPNPGPQTWEWDGSAWRLTHLAPFSRAQHAMAYDPVDDVVVLYGGLVNSQPSDQTWEYKMDPNGVASWSQRTLVYPVGIERPPALSGHAMVYDSQRQTVVMFGGRSNASSSPTVSDAWAWDRARKLWTKLETTDPPPPRMSFGMSYDENRSVEVVFGDISGRRDTWELRSGFPGFDMLSGDQVVADFGVRLDLSVRANGIGPFFYQWFKDGVPLSELGCGGISGTQSDTLVIDPVNAADAGEYRVSIANRCNINTPFLSAPITVFVDQSLNDCNRNGRSDSQDILCGGENVCGGIAGSFDCDRNGVPDECRSAGIPIERFFDFETPDLSGVTLNGTATLDAGSIRLTEAVNSQIGSVVFDAPSATAFEDFQTEFDFRMGPGSSPGADGLSFALMDAEVYGPATLFGEEGPGGQALIIKLDTYDNGDQDLSGNFVQVVHNDVPIAAYEPTFLMDDGRWYHVAITMENGQMTVEIFSRDDPTSRLVHDLSIPGFKPARWRYGFGGRTGGLNNEHRVDNILFSTTSLHADCDRSAVLPCEVLMGDANADGFVDVLDQNAFTDCLAGASMIPQPPAPLSTDRCLAVFDFDADGDVDLHDAQSFITAIGS